MLAVTSAFVLTAAFAPVNASAECAMAHKAAKASVLSAQPLIQAVQIQSQVSTMGINWKVGDKADYKMSGGFISGTVKSFVREVSGSDVWVQQDMDLGFLGKQKVEILFDAATGQVKKILANGQEQQLPSTSNIEVVDTHEDRVTVPAGTFDAIYAKIKDRDSGDLQEAWINPQEVPITGMVKAIADSQFGKITQELTAKSFAP